MDIDNVSIKIKKSPFKDKKLLTVCPKCQHIPLLSISDAGLKVQCNCTFSEVLTLKNYIDLVQKISKPINETSCSEHPNVPFENYCLECKFHFCNKCHQSHISHQTQNMNQLFDTEKLIEKKNLLKSAKQYIKDVEIIKNKQISQSKQTAEDLDKNFKIFKEKNEQIIQFIQLLIDNFNIGKKNNYFICANLINNTHFSYDPIQQERSLVHFLEKSRIIKYYQENQKQIIQFRPQIKFEPDGTQTVVCLQNFTKPSEEQMVRKFLGVLTQNFIKNENFLRELKSIKLHDDIINHLLVLKNKKIASSSRDKTIKIYNLLNYKIDINITQLNAIASYLSELENGNLAAALIDGNLQLFSLSDTSYQVLAILNAHFSSIIQIVPIPNKRMATCSFDNTIKFWECDSPYTCIKVLDDKKSYFDKINELFNLQIEPRSMDVLPMSSFFIIGCIDGSIIFVDLTKLKYKTVIKSIPIKNTNGIKCMGKNLVLVVGKKEADLFAVMESNKIETVKKFYFPFETEVSAISNYCTFHFQGVIMGTKESEVFELNFLENKIIFYKHKAHNEEISSIVQLNDNFLCTGSITGEVKVWSEKANEPPTEERKNETKKKKK